MHPMYPLLPDIARSRTEEQQAAATRWRKRTATRPGRPAPSQTWFRFRLQSMLSLLLTL